MFTKVKDVRRAFRAKRDGVRLMEVDYAGDGSGVYVTRRGPIERGGVSRSVEADEAVILDYDVSGNLVGVEIAASPVSDFRRPVEVPAPPPARHEADRR